MAFNPDAFIAKNKSFNPDAFIAKNKPQPKVETIPTKQETVTLPPPQRSVMSAITNPKVESAKSTAQPTLKETPGVSKPMPNPMLPMGGGSFAVKPQETVTQEQQPQTSWLDDLQVLGSETLKGIKGGSYSVASGAVNNSYQMGKMSLGAVPGTAMPMIPNLETRNKVEQGYKNAPSSPLARELYDKSKQYAQTEGTGWKGFVGQAVGNAIPYMAASVAGGLVNPAAPFMVGFAVEGNEAYFEAIDSGASEEDARLNQVIVGTVNAAIEQLQVGGIFKFAKSGKQATKELVDAVKDKAFKKLAKTGGKLSLDTIKNATTEGLEEALQETTSILAANRVGADISGKEAARRIGSSALGGAVVGGIMGVGGRVINNTVTNNTDVTPNTPTKPIQDEVFGQGLGIGENLPAQSTPAVQTPEVKGNEVGIQNNAAQGNVDGSGANVQETQNIVPEQGDMAKKSEKVDISNLDPKQKITITTVTGDETMTVEDATYRIDELSDNDYRDGLSADEAAEADNEITAIQDALSKQTTAQTKPVEQAETEQQKTQNIVPNPVDMAKKSENNGKIYKVYHGGSPDIKGTPTVEFAQKSDIRGVYFTQDKSVAEDFAKEQIGEHGIVKEYQVILKNPATDAIVNAKIAEGEDLGYKEPHLGDWVTDELLAEGYDGAIREAGYGDEIVAFTNEAISALDSQSKPATISPVQENEVARDNIAPQDTTEAGGQKALTQEVKEKTETQNEEPKGGGSVIGDPIVGSTNAIDSGRIKVDMEPKGKPQTAREIVDYVGRAFNIPIRGKATHTRLAKRALGWFDTKHTGIRLVDVRSLTTAMHEIGHHIDYTLSGRISKTPPTSAIGVELTKLGKALYGNKKAAGGYKSEGFAEYIRKYLTDDSPESTPALHKWFTETYLEEHTDISSKLAKTKTMIDKWRMQGAEARVDSQISTKKIKGSWSERIEKGMLWLDTTQRDELAPIRTAMKNAGIGKDELSPSDDPYQIAVARADTAGAIAEHFVIEYTTDLAGNRTGKGLREVLAPVSKDIKNFTRWIVAARARLLLKKGVNPGISQADADYIYEKYDNQQWQDTLQEITDWNHRLIDYLVEAGGMSTESAQLIKDTNPIYIPFMRAFKEGEIRGGGVGKSIAKAGKAVKKIKGSGREIIDPIESMIKQCEKIISTAHKAEVAHALARLADKKGTASMIWKVPAPQQATRFEAEQLKKDIAKIAYDRMGLDPELVSSSMLEHWDEVLTVYSNASQYYGKDNIVALVVDGKQQFYEVDPALYEAIEGLDQYTLPWVLDVVLGKPNRMVRLGATGLNASFGLIRNFLRDAATFTVLSKHAKAGPLSAIKGVVEDIIDTPNAQRFKAVGGKMASQVLADRKAAQHLKKRVLKNTISGEVFYTVAHPIDALRELFGVTEAGTRIGEFGPALKYGEKKWGKNSKAAVFYALNQSKDVTTNFSRHGKMAKVLNQIIPFYNAAIQGPDKIVRTFRERPFTTTVKAIAALTIPAIWAWWDSKDEDWYKNLPVYERVNYLHFKIPGTDKIIRIPVPFELGHIFMSAPVAALDAQYRKDPKIVTEMFEESLKQANPFDWPAAVSPIIDVLKNEDFAGRPIVSKASEYKLPEDQYGNYTTQLMKIIGQQLKVPPAQLEHIVNGYSGGLYQRVSKSIDLTTQEEITAGDLPVLGTLFLKEPYAPKAQLERFYDRRDLLNQKYASDKISSTEIKERVILNKQSKKLSAQWEKLPEAKTATERKNIHLEMTRILTGE